MSDVELWCPRLAAGATLVTVNQRLARHFLRRYDAWQIQQGAISWETPNIVSWQAWLLQLHDDALCDGLIENTVLSPAADERLWQQAVQQVLAKTHQVLLDIHGAAHQAQTAWAIQHAWHCHVGESAELSDDQKTYQLWCNACCRNWQKLGVYHRTRCMPVF